MLALFLAVFLGWRFPVRALDYDPADHGFSFYDGVESLLDRIDVPTFTQRAPDLAGTAFLIVVKFPLHFPCSSPREWYFTNTPEPVCNLLVEGGEQFADDGKLKERVLKIYGYRLHASDLVIHSQTLSVFESFEGRHTDYDSSARARSKGPSVLGIRQKRQRIMKG